MKQFYQQGLIKIEKYQGPLDLLLNLIRDKKLDIFEVNLEEVANQYLQIIEYFLNNDIELVSEYLVMAATLINLKARMLLKSPTNQHQITKQKENLLKRLLEYQQFKNLALFLSQQSKKRQLFLDKEAEKIGHYILAIDPKRLDGKGNVLNLINVVRKMFERSYLKTLKQTTVTKFNWSPLDAQKKIRQILDQEKNVSFEKIFHLPTMNHFVVAWLALLDMARKQEIFLEQAEQFGEIKIKRRGQND